MQGVIWGDNWFHHAINQRDMQLVNLVFLKWSDTYENGHCQLVYMEDNNSMQHKIRMINNNSNNLMKTIKSSAKKKCSRSK